MVQHINHVWNIMLVLNNPNETLNLKKKVYLYDRLQKPPQTSQTAETYNLHIWQDT